jgi:hypothetical protein
MLVLVTIQTEQLPIATVGRIVVVIVISMMDREAAQLLAVAEIPSATRADPGMNLERLRPHVLSSIVFAA